MPLAKQSMVLVNVGFHWRGRGAGNSMTKAALAPPHLEAHFPLLLNRNVQRNK